MSRSAAARDPSKPGIGAKTEALAAIDAARLAGTHIPTRPMTEAQRMVARYVAQGLSWTNALAKAGLANDSANVHRMSRDPRIQHEIKHLLKKFEQVNNITRKQVYDGLLEAIDIGRTVSDPHAMIKGWSEIAKMAGYYAPDVKKIEISVAAKRLTGQFEQMTDEDLLRLVEEDVIDVSSKEIPEEAAFALESGEAQPGAELAHASAELRAALETQERDGVAPPDDRGPVQADAGPGFAVPRFGDLVAPTGRAGGRKGNRVTNAGAAQPTSLHAQDAP